MAALSGGGTVHLASSGGCVTKCSYVCAGMNSMVHFLSMKKKKYVAFQPEIN